MPDHTYKLDFNSMMNIVVIIFGGFGIVLLSNIPLVPNCNNVNSIRTKCVDMSLIDYVDQENRTYVGIDAVATEMYLESRKLSRISGLLIT
jgi:hypothetical protein